MPSVSSFLADLATDVIGYLADPQNQGKLQNVVSGAQLAATVLNLLGQSSLAQKITDLTNQVDEAAAATRPTVATTRSLAVP